MTNNRRYDQASALQVLKRLTFFTLGFTIPDRNTMQGTIEDIVNDSHGEESKELAFAIGNAYSALVAWHIRGAERKKYLEMVIHYYEKAGAKAALGAFLIREAQVRDLDKGIELLTDVYRKSSGYLPVLCALVEGLYKKGLYAESAKLAFDLHERAKYLQPGGDALLLLEQDDENAYEEAIALLPTQKDWEDACMRKLEDGSNEDPPTPLLEEWKDCIKNGAYSTKESLREWLEHKIAPPPAPLVLAAKALRADAARRKKLGDFNGARSLMLRIIVTGNATSMDQKKLDNLTKIIRTTGPKNNSR